MSGTFDAEFWARENYFAIADLNGAFHFDQVFRAGTEVWSTDPSEAALKAVPLFRRHGVKRVLDVGCGYGRDLRFFRDQNFEVMGIDRSPEGCARARTLLRESAEPRTLPAGSDRNAALVIEGDFRSWNGGSLAFDAVFSFKTLHQFRHRLDGSEVGAHRNYADTFVRQMARCARPGGYLSICTFSTEDQNYGRGRFIEEDTFDTRGHRPCAFYSQERLVSLLSSFELLEIEHLSVPEDHPPDGPHTHRMWFAYSRIREGGVTAGRTASVAE